MNYIRIYVIIFKYAWNLRSKFNNKKSNFNINVKYSNGIR